MLRINKDVRIAVSVLESIALRGDVFVSSQDLALESNTTKVFIQSICAKLVAAGILLSRRGRSGGGYKLASQIPVSLARIGYALGYEDNPVETPDMPKNAMEAILVRLNTFAHSTPVSARRESQR
jgi:DNA-binding IscR family transcriptional regulator